MKTKQQIVESLEKSIWFLDKYTINAYLFCLDREDLNIEGRCNEKVQSLILEELKK